MSVVVLTTLGHKEKFDEVDLPSKEPFLERDIGAVTLPLFEFRIVEQVSLNTSEFCMLEGEK